MILVLSQDKSSTFVLRKFLCKKTNSFALLLNSNTVT